MTPPNLSLILVMICFWITFWVVQKFLLGPVGRVLDERKQRITTANETWEAENAKFFDRTNRVEADLDDAARTAARTREELRTEANAVRQDKLAKTREEVDRRLVAAMDELDGQVSTARADLRIAANGLASMFAGKLLGREVKS
jgi:F0F1-type ATP synthase membrane subunit b/b'